MSIESEVVKDVANPIRGYLEIAAVIIVAGAVGLFVWHERTVGEHEIEKADARAEVQAKAAADAKSKLNQERATTANAQSDHDEQLIRDYLAQHPSEPVRLCYSNGGSVGVPQAGAGHGAASAGPSAGPAVVPAVLRGSETQGPDIGPELNTIVQASSELAIASQNWQNREYQSAGK